jgi:hypothetical protein
MSSTLSGTVPVEEPMPRLSSRISSRCSATRSTRAGSQLSRLPRKCWRQSSGGASVSAFPNCRVEKLVAVDVGHPVFGR